MMVYVVLRCFSPDPGEVDAAAVYSSEEKAEQVAKQHGNLWVEEVELDAAPQEAPRT